MKCITIITNHSGIDTNSNMTGLSRYTKELYRELLKRKDIQVSIKETPAPSSIISVIGKLFRKDLNTVLKGTPLTFPEINKNEIIHCTNQNLAIPLLWKKRKSIVTVHDLIPIARKEYNSAIHKFLFFLIKKALSKATHIIADSNYTKKDIVRFIGYPEEKITVIPLGIDPNEFFDKKIKREKNTILYVGSEHKRKNIELIIKAIALLAKEIPDIQLVKVGEAQDNKNRKKLQLLAKNIGVENRIIWKDYIDNLADEYNKAAVFVFPSLYEGFGFPVLEAMASGCPVICSNRTSLPELAGDAAVYINGEDEKELADAIKKVLRSQQLQEKLQKKGLTQAKKFTWEKCAEETVKVYHQFMI